MNKLAFWVIIAIAVILRFWQLGNVPPSPDWDEASLGYNAYSIMMTGRDEYGEFLPIILRSFDDYKPGLYTYLIIPFIKLFDLNIVSVRLPSAIFGVLAVIGTYFLVSELFSARGPDAPHPRPTSSPIHVRSGLRALVGGPPLRVTPRLVALFSSALLAISPWHIQFSRIAFEAQVGLSLNIFSILFFIKGLKRGIYLIVSVIFASASIYMYQSEKVILPILFLALLLIYRIEILKTSKKTILSAILVGLVFSLPMLLAIFGNQNALMRARGVSVFSDQTQFLKRSAEKIAEDKKNNDLVGQVVDNRRFEYIKAITRGYMSHFNFNWLFITGDIERHHAPNMGLLYLFELPLLLIGVYMLIFGNFNKKNKITIFAIFLIAPIPASITSGVPHAVRTINFLPTFQIFTALGLLGLFSWLREIRFGRLLAIGYLLFMIFNFSYYVNQYFVQQNYYFSQNWQYGYREAIDYIRPIIKNYKKVIVTNDRPLDQSYIFFLYYLKYDPKKYLNEGGTVTGGFKENHAFGNFEFRGISFDSEQSGNLYIGRPDDFPAGSKVFSTIKYLNDDAAIKIVEK